MSIEPMTTNDTVEWAHEGDVDDQVISSLLDNVRSLRAVAPVVLGNIDQAQQRQKRNYDKRHQQQEVFCVKFTINDLVGQNKL